MSGERNCNFSINDLQNSLFLHPSEGSSSIFVDDKLVGAQNYRSWRRSLEIGLSTKRKLGFVKGSVKRPDEDQPKAELWDTVNNMVISWILSSVCDSIQKSILFIDSTNEIWTHLERRFCLSNGSRKYKINREIYELKQCGISVSEYYSKMKCLWVELDAMDDLPRVTVLSDEMTEFLKKLSGQREENKLFKFLNGLDDVYNAQRS